MGIDKFFEKFGLSKPEPDEDEAGVEAPPAEPALKWAGSTRQRRSLRGKSRRNICANRTSAPLTDKLFIIF